MRSTPSSGRSPRQLLGQSQAMRWPSAASSPKRRNKAIPPSLTIRGLVGLGPAIFALLGALIFLAYPLTDTRFREIVKELHARQGIKDDRSDAAMESVDATAPLRES